MRAVRRPVRHRHGDRSRGGAGDAPGLRDALGDLRAAVGEPAAGAARGRRVRLPAQGLDPLGGQLGGPRLHLPAADHPRDHGRRAHQGGDADAEHHDRHEHLDQREPRLGALHLTTLPSPSTTSESVWPLLATLSVLVAPNPAASPRGSNLTESTAGDDVTLTP